MTKHNIDKILEPIFEVFSLSKKDLYIYKTLLMLNQATSSRVSKEISIPRQTVHSILVKLKKSGLISLSNKSGVQIFVADPELLHTTIQKKREVLSSIERCSEEAITSLVKLKRKYVKRPLVKYYDGSIGLEHLFSSMLTYYKEKNSVKEFRGYGINTYSITSIQKYLTKFIKKRATLGVRTRLLIGAGSENFTKGMANKLNIHCKHTSFIPQNAGIYILEGRVYLFSFNDNAGLVIENETIARLLIHIFDDQWSRI
jgi:sugar-specific transcriptional regulator TrmB